MIAPYAYRDRAGLTRCVGCSHVAGHPAPCGARRLLGDACTCTGLPTTTPYLTGAAGDSTASAAPVHLSGEVR